MKISVQKFNIDNIRTVIFTGLLALILGLASYYIFLVNKSVVNIVASEQYDRVANLTDNQVVDLEQNYVVLKNSINIELADKLGYKDDLKKIHFSSSFTGFSGLSLKDK